MNGSYNDLVRLYGVRRVAKAVAEVATQEGTTRRNAGRRIADALEASTDNQTDSQIDSSDLVISNEFSSSKNGSLRTPLLSFVVAGAWPVAGDSGRKRGDAQAARELLEIASSELIDHDRQGEKTK